MPTKSSHLETYSALTKTRRSDRESPPPLAMLVKRALPYSSLQKANKIFRNFSLSKFPEGSLPANYVHSHKDDASLTHAERIRQVQDHQKKKIEQRLHKLKAAEQDKADDKAVRGVTLALPKDRAGKLLPSYNEEERTVTLDHVISLITKHMKGTEFHAKGDPTLNRLAFLKRVEKLKKNLGLDGYPVTVIDTAGIRETDDPIEQEGLRRARAPAAEVDLVLRLTGLDAREEQNGECK